MGATALTPASCTCSDRCVLLNRADSRGQMRVSFATQLIHNEKLTLASQCQFVSFIIEVMVPAIAPTPSTSPLKAKRRSARETLGRNVATMPSFLHVDSLMNMGVEPEDIIDHPGWFVDFDKLAGVRKDVVFLAKRCEWPS